MAGKIMAIVQTGRAEAGYARQRQAEREAQRGFAAAVRLARASQPQADIPISDVGLIAQ